MGVTQKSPPRIQRKDPKPTLVTAEEQADPNWALINADPNLHYVWANANPRGQQSADYYESRGYEPVVKTPDGVRPLLGAKRVQLGQNFEREGMILMFAKKEVAEEINATRMARYDQMERTFIKSAKSGFIDALRGIGGNRGGQYVRPDPELTRISEAEAEVDFS